MSQLFLKFDPSILGTTHIPIENADIVNLWHANNKITRSHITVQLFIKKKNQHGNTFD